MWKERFNAHKPRWDPQKVNPSGVSPNVAFALPEKYNGLNCLRKFTQDSLELLRQLKQQLHPEELMQFVPPDFATRCQEALDSLDLVQLSFTNVWTVYQKIFNIVFEEEN